MAERAPLENYPAGCPGPRCAAWPGGYDGYTILAGLIPRLVKLTIPIARLIFDDDPPLLLLGIWLIHSGQPNSCGVEIWTWFNLTCTYGSRIGSPSSLRHSSHKCESHILIILRMAALCWCPFVQSVRFAS